MTEDGSSIICAGATLEVASLLVVRSAGCTKAEAPARVSAKMERRMWRKLVGGVDLLCRPTRRRSSSRGSCQVKAEGTNFGELPR